MTKLNKIRIEYMREGLRTTSTAEKIRENKLRLFGLVERRNNMDSQKYKWNKIRGKSEKGYAK